MTDHLAALNELLAEPEALAQAVAKSGPQEGDAQRIALGLIVSAWECYRGIRALVERRLVEEARMLSRTLIDDMALLMWFVVRRGELEHLALRFFYTGVVDSERIQNAAELAGFSWVEDMKAERAKELKAICEAADEAGITLRKLPNTRQLLEELHQERLYYWHTRASQGIHSTPIGLSARLKLPEVEGDPIGIPLEGDPDLVVQVGVVAAETFIGALAAACNLLGWDEQRVRDAGEGFTPRAHALFDAVTGKPEPDEEPPKL